MKRILITILFSILFLNVKAQVSVVGYIIPAGGGTFPTNIDTNQYGGFSVVSDTFQRNRIPAARRERGMQVYSVSNGFTYILKSGIANSNWSIYANPSDSLSFVPYVGATKTLNLGLQTIKMDTMYSSNLKSSRNFSSGIVYVDSLGLLTVDTLDLVWDDNNKRLGVNQQGLIPSAVLDIHASNFNVPIAQFNQTSTTQGATQGAIVQTQADPAAAINNLARIGVYQFAAAVNTTHLTQVGAAFAAYATENWSTTANGCRLSFLITANGTTTRTQALNLNSDTSATFYGKIIKNGGTSAQFLKADGSVDNNAYWQQGGNTFGAVGRLQTNDLNSLTIGTNSKVWDSMSVKGRRSLYATSSNSDTSTGITTGLRINDTTSQTGTSTHTALYVNCTNSGSINPNLLQLLYNGTSVCVVGYGGQITSSGGASFTGSVTSNSTLTGAVLSISRSSSTSAPAAIINQQQPNTGALLVVRQGGVNMDTVTNAGGWYELGTGINVYGGTIQTPALLINAIETTVSGSTSGSAKFSQPFQSSSTGYKKIKISCSALVGTASYTFPVSFTNTPAIISTNEIPSSIVTTLTTTSITITGATTSGYLFIEGD